MNRGLLLGGAAMVGVIAGIVVNRHSEEIPLSGFSPAGDQWSVEEVKDPLDPKQTTVKAEMTATAESNGRTGKFEVTATCPDQGLEFSIAYFSDPKGTIGYKLKGNEVDFRVALDGNIMPAFSHPDFKNRLALQFNTERSSLFESPTPADIYHAKLLKLELPLENGDMPILEIRPQDRGFQEFASRCGGVAVGGEQTGDGTARAGDPAEPDKIGSLLAAERDLNEKCRGGSGDAAATQDACDRRDGMVQRLNELGWCYGKEDQPSVDYDWHPCGPNSLKQ